MADSRAEEWMKRGDQAFAESLPMMQLYERIREIFYPDRQSFITRRTTGEEGYDAISDGWPLLMRMQMANSFGTLARPRGREWFKVTSKQWKLNDRTDVLKWCGAASEIQRRIVYDHRAQFTAQKSIADNDRAAFGTAVEKTTLNNDLTGVLFRTLHLADVAGELNSENAVDVTHERMIYRARNIEELLGGNTKGVPRAIAETIKKNPLEEIELRFCCGPVSQYEPGKRRPFRGAKFFGLLMDPDSKTVIREEFFTSYPYLWRRFMQVSGELWGRSPCALASLGDARMLQEIDPSMAEAIERAANPGWMIRNDGVVGDPDLAPGGVTFTKGEYDFKTGRPIEPVPTGAQPGWAIEYRRDKRQFVASAWLQDLLRLPTDREMTAYEVTERLEQLIREGAPLLEPEEADNAAQQLRVFDISDRHGAFPPRPPILRGVDADIDLDTALTRAFAKLRVQEGVQVAETVGKFAEIEGAAGQTAAFKRVDWAAMQRDVMKGLGPAHWLRDEEEAEEEIAQSQQDAEAERMLQLGADTGIMDALMNSGDPAGGAPALPAPGQADAAGLVPSANAGI